VIFHNLAVGHFEAENVIPRVSVLMPVFDPDPKYFAEAIESVLSQSMHDWELLIVEDPSRRKVADTLRNFSDPRIRHFANAVRTSLVFQRNRTLGLARGQYVAMLDADDVAEPNRFEEQCHVLDTDTRTGVVGFHKTKI
jgi:glycosyltransferase involved in cell wall biosynthesis